MFLPLRLGGICTWPPGTQSDVIMGDIHLKGSFNKIRVWSWEPHLPQLPTLFWGRKKRIMFFWAATKIWNKKKTPQMGKKIFPADFPQTLGSWKSVSLAKRSQCRHSRHGSCGEKFVVCRGDDQMMILWIYGFQLLWLLWFIIINYHYHCRYCYHLHDCYCDDRWLLLVMIPAMMMIARIHVAKKICGPGGQLQPEVQFYRLKPRCEGSRWAAMIVIDRGIYNPYL